MDPTWEETSAASADAVRAPASLNAVKSAPPKWEDTQDASVAAQPSWDETTDLQQQYGDPAHQQKALAQGLLQGVTGPLAPVLERAMGVSPEEQRMLQEANPLSSGAGEFLGFAAPEGLGALTEAGKAIGGAFTLPGLVSKIGHGVTSALGLGKAKGLAKIAAKSVQMGAELGALQGSSELTKAIQQDPSQTVGSAIENVGLSTAVGMGLGLPFGSVSAAWDKLSGPEAQRILNKIKADWSMGDGLNQEEQIVSPVLKARLNIFGGVPKDIMEEYAANRDAIRAAPEFSEVYGHALDHILEMQDNLATKKDSVKTAQAAFDKFLDQQTTALRQAGYDAAQADKIARQAASAAEDRIAIGLQNNAIEAAPKAFSAVEKLRQNVFDLSAKARDILDKTPGTMPLKPFNDAIREMQDELYSQGFPHLAEALQKEADMWGAQYGKEIDYPNAKSMIQGLSKKGKWSSNATAFDNGLAPYYNRLRFVVDDALKDAVPAYRTAMEPTADATALLKKLNRYGTPEGATTAVKGLTDPFRYANEMPLLRKVEANTGINFADPIEQYANPDVRQKMIEAHPDYKTSLKTAAALQQLKDPETIAALKQAPYLSQPARNLSKAELMLQQQQERMAEFKGVTSNTLEGKLKSVMAGRGMAAARALEGIPGMESMGDRTIPEILHLIHVREAFEKGAMNGSRNVNLLSKTGGGLGTVVGGITGAILGHPIIGGQIGGAAGAGAGAYFGGVLDKEGPAIVKAALDRYLDKYGDMPKVFGTTPSTIKAALLHFLGKDVPPSAGAFKSTVNYIDAQKSGGRWMKAAVKSIFQGSKTLPNHVWTNQDKINKLDERTKKLQGNEQGLLDTGGNLGRYMPEHGIALSQTVARAVNYINQNRPMSQKLAPLDPEIEPPKEQVRAFNRGLELAEQPMSIIKRIKDGTLLPDDVQHLNAMYPEYYQHMKSEIMDSMNEHLADGGKIPYSLRQSLSLFMGETLDSSLSQPNLMAAQSVFQAQRAALQMTPPPSQAKKSMSKGGGPSQQYRTAEQSAQYRKSQPS